MSSNIVFNSIDANYPVAGVDNDTQGFRDNFRIIKTGLETANTEISSLQSNTAKLNASNNFNGNAINEARFIASGDTVNNKNILSGNTELPWSQGGYFAAVLNGNLTLTLSDWPVTSKGIAAKMYVQVSAQGANRTLTFAVPGVGVIKRSGFTNPVTINNDGSVSIFEFVSIDGGATVLGRLVGTYQ
jgi:hypothetical protein